MCQRCHWANQSALEQRYHDEEWGVPCWDDRTLFEFLILESAQAGLSWRTILAKRAGYRRLYCGFDPQQVARFTEADIQRLLADSAIVRNRRKIEAACINARVFLALQAKYGSFARFAWAFVDGVPRQNAWQDYRQVPAQTDQSHALSKALQREGMRFVGPTICYAFMQAVGMVNDHEVGCWRYLACQQAGVPGPAVSSSRC